VERADPDEVLVPGITPKKYTGEPAHEVVRLILADPLDTPLAVLSCKSKFQPDRSTPSQIHGSQDKITIKLRIKHMGLLLFR